MYIRGGEPLAADVQSLSAVPQSDSDESESVFDAELRYFMRFSSP